MRLLVALAFASSALFALVPAVRPVYYVAAAIVGPAAAVLGWYLHTWSDRR